MGDKVQVFRADNAGEEFDVTAPQTVIGRGDECGVRLADPSVSRTHAKLLREADGCYIEDLGSRNGTFVNGKPLAEKLRLQEGDRIAISGITLVFHSSPTDSPPPAEIGEESSMTIVDRVNALASVSRVAKASAERQLQAMLQILQALGGTLDLETLLDTMLGALLEVFPQADRGLVLLLENGKLIPKAHRHRRDASDSIAYSRTIVQQAIDRREATLMWDAGQEMPISRSIESTGIRSAMCVPLFSQDKQPLGVLQVDANRLRRAFDRDDLHVLTCVAAQVSMAVEHTQLARLLLDLQLAEEVQQSFLPQEVAAMGQYRYWGQCQSARRVGGDFYDFFPLPDGSQAALLGDVSGKGLPAALMMAKVATVCRVALRDQPDDLARVVGRANREIHDSGRAGQFVTCVLCVIHPETGEITMASAGHMSPVICRSDGGVLVPMSAESNGPPLGVCEEFPYETVSAKLEAGESAVLYSDGLSEAENPQGRMYTTEKIAQTLLGMQGKHPEEIGRVLLDDLRRFVGDREQSDDISIVVFGRKETSEP